MSETVKEICCPECDLRDRHSIANDYYIQFLNRTDSMFKWSGRSIDVTIPQYILERYLKTIGWCGIGKAPNTAKKHAGELVCFFGGLGQEPDMYYQPTHIILANPVLGSKDYEIGKDVVWAKNDSCARGISQLLARYSHLLAANDISINIAQVTTRMPFVLTAETESEKDSAERFIKQAEEGKLGIIKTSSFNKGVEPKSTVDASGNNTIKALIELHQYLKAGFYNDLGVGSNFNMKRERMSRAEVENNSPPLLPLVDEMLKFRQKICEEVNAMFPGEDWSVELDSAWKLEDERQELEVEQMKEDSRTLEEPEVEENELS